jgi:hypothetical protein
MKILRWFIYYWDFRFRTLDIEQQSHNLHCCIARVEDWFKLRNRFFKCVNWVRLVKMIVFGIVLRILEKNMLKLKCKCDEFKIYIWKQNQVLRSEAIYFTDLIRIFDEFVFKNLWEMFKFCKFCFECGSLLSCIASWTA